MRAVHPGIVGSNSLNRPQDIANFSIMAGVSKILLADSIGITSKANSETTIQQHQYNHSEISATLLAIPLAGYATDEAWIQILRHREFTHGGFCNDLAS